MSRSVAVLGAGVAGLSAAYELRHDFDVTVFESSDRAGGHAHTVEVDDSGRRLGLDTAFIVFNEPNYPRLSRFFRELDVPMVPHKGGFLFFDLDGSLRYSTEDLDIPEDELRTRYSEQFQNISREAKRFYEQAPRDFVRGRADVPLGEYLDREGYSDDFKYGFIVLQASAVWSAPAEMIWDIPAATIIGYFWSHGHGGLGGRNVDWHTVHNGSQTYVATVLAELDAAGAKVHTSTPVSAVRVGADDVEVHADGAVQRFDQVVVATHADQARELVDGLADEQRTVLDKVAYNTTNVVLHTDVSVMPPEREKWRSWNYGRVREGRDIKGYVVYYLNEIQQFTAEHDYFLSLDSPLAIDPEKVIASFDYMHPIVDGPVRSMQKGIHAINEVNRVKFCGSYFHCRKMGRDSIASHEAAFDSGAAAAASVRRAAGN